MTDKHPRDMSVDELYAEFKDAYLPEWAIGRTEGKLVLGAHLPTRDGRCCGNAHIIAIEETKWKPVQPLYIVMTDAGTTIRMTAAEVAERFHPPQYVSCVADVLKRFSVP